MKSIIPAAALNQHIAILGKTGRRRRLPIPAPKLCLECGASFQPTAKYPQQRFCSRKCGFKATLPPGHNATIARAFAQKRGDMQRGRGEGKTYMKLNGRHAHRVIAEQKIGRALLPGEVVHHIDGNLRNNHPDNLQVLPSQAVHNSIHFKGKPSPKKGKHYPHLQKRRSIPESLA